MVRSAVQRYHNTKIFSELKGGISRSNSLQQRTRSRAYLVIKSLLRVLEKLLVVDRWSGFEIRSFSVSLELGLRWI